MRYFSVNQTISYLFGLEYNKKRAFLVLCDLLLILIAVFFALFTSQGDVSFINDQETYYICLIAVISTQSILFKKDFYRTYARHMDYKTALATITACFTSGVILLVLDFLVKSETPATVAISYVSFSIIGISGARFFIRAMGQNLNRNERKNVAIYGAGSAGRQLVEALNWNPNYRVCVIIDDNTKLHSKSISGVNIVGFEKAKASFERQNVSTVLLAIPSATPEIQKQLSSRVLREAKVHLKSIPDFTSLIAGTASITDLQDIDIEDLLSREPTQPNHELMKQSIEGRTILVTGAGGSIGSELSRQIALLAPAKLVIMDLSEHSIYSLINELNHTKSSFPIIPVIGSVKNQELVRNVLQNNNINSIYHAAAYKHVPLMEQNIMECMSNNVMGTLSVLDEAIAAKVKSFTLISTDKAVNPTNFMGASKRFCELICSQYASKQKHTSISMVRFGNVLGSSGSVVPLFKQQINSGGPVTLTHEDITRFFMTIPEAAQLVLQAGALSNGGEIYVLDMGEPVKIIDLAQNMIILSGKKPVFAPKIPMDAEEILIKITGIRPGEKLFEELSYSNSLSKTAHARIRIATEKPLHANELEGLMLRLYKTLEENNEIALRQIVYGYFGDFSKK